MAVTQKDIADYLGVSRRLVGYALNDEYGVSVETRSIILAAAQELGYKPNRAAKALVTGRTNQIALCLPTLNLPYHLQFLYHFEKFARENNYSLIITTTHEMNSLSTLLVDGFIIHSSSPLSLPAKPTVLVQSPPIYATTSSDAIFDQIIIDLQAASEQAVNHLLQTGATRIAHVTAIDPCDNDPRYKSYVKEMKQKKLPTEIISVDIIRSQPLRCVAQNALQKYFIQNGVPEALFCSNDDIAIGAYRALREIDEYYPQKIAITGCDNIPEASDLFPSLTTIEFPWEEICQNAWNTLLNRINNPATPQIQKTYAGELLIRDSTKKLLKKE